MVRRLSRELRALVCAFTTIEAPKPCWDREDLTPPDYCDLCKGGIELAQERKVARAAVRAAQWRQERAVRALNKTIYGVAARAA